MSHRPLLDDISGYADPGVDSAPTEIMSAAEVRGRGVKAIAPPLAPRHGLSPRPNAIVIGARLRPTDAPAYRDVAVEKTEFIAPARRPAWLMPALWMVGGGAVGLAALLLI